MIKADEDYTRIFSQNEVLKERNDILYKLGKGYTEHINERDHNNAHRVHFDIDNNEQSNNPEIIEIDNTENEANDRQGWTHEKLRGFKRKQSTINSNVDQTTHVNPPPASSNGNNRTNDQQLNERELNQDNVGNQNNGNSDANRNNSGRLCHYFSNTGWCRYEERTGRKCNFIHEVNQNNRRHQNEGFVHTPERGRICHYFANTGWCSYEDRTGRRCKFIHVASGRHEVSMCPQGINCDRPRCPLAHPRIRQNWNEYSNGTFLGIARNGMQTMNPWQQNQIVDNQWRHQMSNNLWQQNQLNQNQRNHRTFFPNQNQMQRN